MVFKRNYTTKQIFSCAVFVILLFVTFKSFSQNSTNLIDLTNPDKTKLEYLIFDEVNKLREANKLPKLVWDEVLYRAANDHAEYLLYKKRLSHAQDSKEKKSPIKRVKVHGGIDYTLVGENILSVTLGVQLDLKGRIKNTVTYESSAESMALMWKYSPNHYKNIINENFNYTALAIAYDSMTQKTVAVQVFGFTNTPRVISKQPDVSEYLLKQPIPGLPYRLKEYKYEKKNQKAVQDFLRMDLDRGFLIGDYKTAKKTFKGIRSGICQEFIPISQYDSNAVDFSRVPNRRNGLYELNGEITKPVYRRRLLKYSRKFSDRDYIINWGIIRIKEQTKQFLYPLKPNSSAREYNLFLIKNKRLETFRTYSMIPGEFFDIPFPDLKYADDFTELDTLYASNSFEITDTISFKVYYPVNEVKLNSNQQAEIRSALDTIPGDIIDMDVSAFASIEGNGEINQKLAEDRMNEFVNLVKPKLRIGEFKPTIETGEQWELFYQQIKGTEYHRLKKLDIEEIRGFVNDHNNDSLLTRLLNEQRFVEFNLIWKQNFKELVPINKKPSEFYDSLLSVLYTLKKPRPSFLRLVEKVQLAYYHELINADTISPGSIIRYPYLPKHPEFEYHNILFRYLVLKNMSDVQFYDELHNLGFSRYFPSRHKKKLLYNNLLLIYKNYLNGTINYLVEDVNCQQIRERDFYFMRHKKIRCKQVKYRPDYYVLKELPRFIAIEKKVNPENSSFDLWRYYYLYLIKDLYNSMPMDREIYQQLSGIRKYYHPNENALTDEERLKLAYLYSNIMKYKDARRLIEPIAIREDPDIEGLKLYITLIVKDFENDHEYANYLISQFNRLGKKEWCDLWRNPEYLNFQMLEDLKLKNFYNCHCSEP